MNKETAIDSALGDLELADLALKCAQPSAADARLHIRYARATLRCAQKSTPEDKSRAMSRKGYRDRLRDHLEAVIPAHEAHHINSVLALVGLAILSVENECE